jgi:hypothetical protein
VEVGANGAIGRNDKGLVGGCQEDLTCLISFASVVWGLHSLQWPAQEICTEEVGQRILALLRAGEYNLPSSAS